MSPDRALLRALAPHLGAHRLIAATSRDWASATFEGARHRLAIALEGEDRTMRAARLEAALAEARRTLDWILAEMGVPAHGGFENTLPVGDGHRQQNPHMHLLEALLALHATSPDRAVLELAGVVKI